MFLRKLEGPRKASGRDVIAMMQAAESRVRQNGRFLHRFRRGTVMRRVLLQTEMSPTIRVLNGMTCQTLAGSESRIFSADST